MVRELSPRPTLLCPDLPPTETAFLPGIPDGLAGRESLREHPFPSARAPDESYDQGTVSSPGPGLKSKQKEKPVVLILSLSHFDIVFPVFFFRINFDF